MFLSELKNIAVLFIHCILILLSILIKRCHNKPEFIEIK